MRPARRETVDFESNAAALCTAFPDLDPSALMAEQARVYDVVTELLERKALSDAAYARAQAFFGDDFLVELICAAGLYTMVAMRLNAFEAPVPATMQKLV